MPRATALLCPCNGRAAYDACCGRWHAGALHLQAPDAEQLMRSRYCAYVLGLNGYLHATWHPSTRPGSLQADDAALRWLGLEIRRHTTDGSDRASVEFIARSKLAGHAHRLHEVSRFVREGGRWYYLDGELRVAQR